MLNQCNFIGRLGADIEVRSMSNGKEVATLSLAVGERWKDKDGNKQESTEWIRITVFSEGLVKVCKSYLKKGSQIYVSGKMKTRKWTDKDGNDKYTTEIVLSGFNGTLTMLDSKGDSDNSGDAYVQQPKQQNQATQGFIDSQLDDEIPFVLIGLGLSLVPFLSMGGIV